MLVLGIDPGDVVSAYVLYDTKNKSIVMWEKLPNEELLLKLLDISADLFAIEMVASYGMPVGREVFETCVMVGRLIQAWPHEATPIKIYRKDVKIHLCGVVKANDSNIRQALIDRFGANKEEAIGRKASPGPLYGLSGDGWAALAVVVTAADAERKRRRAVTSNGNSSKLRGHGNLGSTAGSASSREHHRNRTGVDPRSAEQQRAGNGSKDRRRVRNRA